MGTFLVSRISHLILTIYILFLYFLYSLTFHPIYSTPNLFPIPSLFKVFALVYKHHSIHFKYQ